MSMNIKKNHYYEAFIGFKRHKVKVIGQLTRFGEKCVEIEFFEGLDKGKRRDIKEWQFRKYLNQEEYPEYYL